jgi:hypothetical protein
MQRPATARADELRIMLKLDSHPSRSLVGAAGVTLGLRPGASRLPLSVRSKNGWSNAGDAEGSAPGRAVAISASRLMTNDKAATAAPPIKYRHFTRIDPFPSIARPDTTRQI